MFEGKVCTPEKHTFQSVLRGKSLKLIEYFHENHIYTVIVK